MVSTVRVWDPFVRIVHWLLAAAVLLAWATGEGWGRSHEWLGYAALALVAVRLPWGRFGPKHARFADFVYSPRHTLAYARSFLTATSPRYLGHNPLGGWMILGLLAAVAATAATGWLYTTDTFWGIEWVGELHHWCADILLALALLHVAGVAAACFRHRENLVAAMIHGYKRTHDVPGPLKK
jgi:cytochrome b